MKKESVLITGGAGFIGSHLCDLFIKKKFIVTCVDNLITGDKKNIRHLISNPNFRFYEIDINDNSKIELIEDKFKFILHFASPASPKEYLKYPIDTLTTGSTGTLNLLNLAKRQNSKILVASTSEVYGNPLIHPQSEDYFGNVNCIGPRSVYDEAKRFMESLTIAFCNKNKIQFAIARIFNTYGPRMKMNDGRAIPNFINQCINDEKITIYGKGLQTRSFCFIDDTIDGIFKLINSNYQLPVNIGNDHEISIIDLAHMVVKILKSKIKLVFKELPEDDPVRRKPDLTLVKKITKWEPKTDLNVGLSKTINYFRN